MVFLVFFTSFSFLYSVFEVWKLLILSKSISILLLTLLTLHTIIITSSRKIHSQVFFKKLYNSSSDTKLRHCLHLELSFAYGMGCGPRAQEQLSGCTSTICLIIIISLSKDSETLETQLTMVNLVLQLKQITLDSSCLEQGWVLPSFDLVFKTVFPIQASRQTLLKEIKMYLINGGKPIFPNDVQIFVN